MSAAKGGQLWREWQGVLPQQDAVEDDDGHTPDKGAHLYA